MGTSFNDAFDALSFLPERKRMLVGQGGDIGDLDWLAGSIDDVDRLMVGQDPYLQRALCDRITEFDVDNAQTAFSVLIDEAGTMTVIVLGVVSIESLADLMHRCAEKIAGDYVSNYLSDKRKAWKRPVAKVIPLRQGPREPVS